MHIYIYSYIYIYIYTYTHNVYVYMYTHAIVLYIMYVMRVLSDRYQHQLLTQTSGFDSKQHISIKRHRQVSSCLKKRHRWQSAPPSREAAALGGIAEGLAKIPRNLC